MSVFTSLHPEPVTKGTRPRPERSVRDVTYQLLREPGLTAIFGNVGSTEEIHNV
jgi:hypothetical protein